MDIGRAASMDSRRRPEQKKYQPKITFSEWDKRNQEIHRGQRDLEKAFGRYKYSETADTKDREKAMLYLDKEFLGIETLAKAFDGTAERLATYPEDLVIPDGKTPYLDPERRRSPFTEEMRPFARMIVGDRTYMFSLTDSGVVNVYRDGKYLGGNNDLVLFEIFSHLQEGSFFGVNG